MDGNTPGFGGRHAKPRMHGRARSSGHLLVALGVLLGITAGFVPAAPEVPADGTTATTAGTGTADGEYSDDSAPDDNGAPDDDGASDEDTRAADPEDASATSDTQPSAVGSEASPGSTSDAAPRTVPDPDPGPGSSPTPTEQVGRPQADLAPAVSATAVEPPPALKVGTITTNTRTGRRETVVDDVGGTVVMIGDSQSSGPDTWPQLAFRTLGYEVTYAGGGGTGFVASNAGNGTANYLDAFAANTWVLPHGDPALIVIQGGGNDAATGQSDAAIIANADTLIQGLRTAYPSSRLMMIGTLSRSAEDNGGRRHEVDALLGGLAASKGMPFISAGDWLTTHGLEDHLEDSVHLTPEGHAQAAAVLLDRLGAMNLDLITAVRAPRSEREHQRIN